MGGTFAYNSTHLAVCLAIVSGHAGGGRSSANLYHPLRARHASFTAPLLRWLLTVDVAFVAHCLRSAARKDLISRLIRRATRVVRCPCLLNVARLSVARSRCRSCQKREERDSFVAIAVAITVAVARALLPLSLEKRGERFVRHHCHHPSLLLCSAIVIQKKRRSEKRGERFSSPSPSPAAVVVLCRCKCCSHHRCCH
jgi:hypothetical protein